MFAPIQFARENSLQSSIKVKQRRTKRRRHIPHSQLPEELVNRRNSRERERIHAVNDAFENLRNHIPYSTEYDRCSKVKILTDAMVYINNLSDMVNNYSDAEKQSLDSSEQFIPCICNGVEYDAVNCGKLRDVSSEQFSATQVTSNINNKTSHEITHFNGRGDYSYKSRHNKVCTESITNGFNKHDDGDLSTTHNACKHMNLDNVCRIGCAEQNDIKTCNTKHFSGRPVLRDITNFYNRVTQQEYRNRNYRYQNIEREYAQPSPVIGHFNLQETELCHKATNFLEDLIPPLM
ncbi:uncharacterized protein LOC134687506 [Mytilus trossulus]|uniref:uncharacterized protein LOC134687506 n=1 Tax=Mytilus trossulus TaxID=6551 RepID=UPI003006B9BA